MQPTPSQWAQTQKIASLRRLSFEVCRVSRSAVCIQAGRKLALGQGVCAVGVSMLLPRLADMGGVPKIGWTPK